MVKRFDFIIKNPKNDAITKRIYEQATNTDITDSTTSTDNLPIPTQDRFFNTKSDISIAKRVKSLKYILNMYRNRIPERTTANRNMGRTNLRSSLWESVPTRVGHIPEPELLLAGNRDRNMVYDAAPLIYFIPFLCSLLGIRTNAVVYDTSAVFATLDLLITNLPLELTALRRFIRHAVSDRLLAAIVDALFFCYVLAYVFWSLLYDDQPPREIARNLTGQDEMPLPTFNNNEEWECSVSNLESNSRSQRSQTTIIEEIRKSEE